MTAATPPDRRADLDWLRVLAFGLLILYHAGMAFSGWSWHIEDAESPVWLREAMRFTNRWRMPLVFVVSGAAIALALGRRTIGGFAADRARRLLLPLVFGMAVIVPPQVYAERVHRGQFAGSFVEWLPQAFTGVYPAGNLSWHHLWFLAYVLVLTALLLPCFLWARTPAGAARLDAASSVVARHHLHWLVPLPLIAIQLWLAPVSSNPNGLVGDWVGLAWHGTLLLYGALLFRSDDLLAALEKWRWVALAIGVAVYAILHQTFLAGTVRPRIAPEDRALFTALGNLDTVAWLFAIIGFARRHLTARPAFLARATEAVYPFYILHQTVTVVAVHWLVRSGLPVGVKFALAAFITFAGTWLLYEFVVRRVDILRPLFGMRPRLPPAPARAQIAAANPDGGNTWVR
ncbi:MAG: acyltransferase family protein [Rhodospirillales bacterium]|nr:MAG: acyltransferase family protein [Rhodospirillales bacterium]